MFYGSMFFGKQPQLIFAKKTHITSLLSIVVVALNIGLNIPFIIKWGAIGAAWATLLAGLISGTVSFIVSQHYYKIKWEYRKVGLIYLIFFASSILMVLLRNLDVVYTIRLMVKCTSITLYIYLGIVIRVISIENYNLVKNIISFKGITLFQRN
jgi:O-antigen/teichoic acid export membrane protein